MRPIRLYVAALVVLIAGLVTWPSPDASQLAFISTSRDHKQAVLRVADAATGAVRASRRAIGRRRSPQAADDRPGPAR